MPHDEHARHSGDEERERRNDRARRKPADPAHAVPAGAAAALRRAESDQNAGEQDERQRIAGARRERGRRERARVSRRRARHDATPSRCRTTNTLAIPVTRNVSVATIERAESRLIPHTPCPLVQPPPCAVPNPTRTPASRTSGSG